MEVFEYFLSEKVIKYVHKNTSFALENLKYKYMSTYEQSYVKM